MSSLLEPIPAQRFVAGMLARDQDVFDNMGPGAYIEAAEGLAEALKESNEAIDVIEGQDRQISAHDAIGVMQAFVQKMDDCGVTDEVFAQNEEGRGEASVPTQVCFFSVFFPRVPRLSETPDVPLSLASASDLYLWDLYRWIQRVKMICTLLDLDRLPYIVEDVLIEWEKAWEEEEGEGEEGEEGEM